MFCPKCATQNVDGASFCRGCGANISLINQALSGELELRQRDLEWRSRKRRRREQKEPTLANGIQELMSGVGFCVVALLAKEFAPAGHIWWFWLLIPAFLGFGKGLSDIIRSRQIAGQANQPYQQIQPNVRLDNLPAPNTSELRPTPPSITEGTTRHLGVEAPTRHLDSSRETQ